MAGAKKYTTRRKRAQIRKKKLRGLLGLVIFFLLSGLGVWGYGSWQNFFPNQQEWGTLQIPEYFGEPYVVVNGNKPFFRQEDESKTSFESYSELDALGRCGVAWANLSRELMPTKERGSIGQIKPTGWKQNKYPGLVNSKPPYLYNRCHLLAHCLTGEDANEKNLITGTRYMNVEGMLPFEEKVARYLDQNDHHVLYRVTPIFEGNDLVARGVLMEAYSIEDKGAGICFCIFCYNVQPGIEIDYKTGDNRKEK